MAILNFVTAAHSAIYLGSSLRTRFIQQYPLVQVCNVTSGQDKSTHDRQPKAYLFSYVSDCVTCPVFACQAAIGFACVGAIWVTRSL